MSISVMEATCFSIGLPIRAAKSGPPPQGVEELFFTTGSFIHGARALIAGDGDHHQRIGDQDQIQQKGRHEMYQLAADRDGRENKPWRLGERVLRRYHPRSRGIRSVQLREKMRRSPSKAWRSASTMNSVAVQAIALWLRMRMLQPWS